MSFQHSFANLFIYLFLKIQSLHSKMCINNYVIREFTDVYSIIDDKVIHLKWLSLVYFPIDAMILLLFLAASPVL